MRTMKLRDRVLWTLMTVASLLIVVVVSRYLTLDPALFFPEQRAVYSAHLIGLLMHVIGGMVTLGVGPFLFLAGVRTRWPAGHRWLGRFYLLGNLVGGVAGLYMSTYAYTGAVARNGFATLALLWLATGLMAYVCIRDRQVAAHRRWLIRNFALTLAGVMLRLELPLLSTVLSFALSYQIIAWSCWLPNLLVAEWLIQRHSVVDYRVGQTVQTPRVIVASSH